MLKPHHKQYYEYFNNKYKEVGELLSEDVDGIPDIINRVHKANTSAEYHNFFSYLKNQLGLNNAGKYSPHLKIEYQHDICFTKYHGQREDRSTYLKGEKKVIYKMLQKYQKLF